MGRIKPDFMHELPVTEGMLQVALEAAEEAGAQRITAINLVIGDLTSIVDDSVQFYFDLLSQETIAMGAQLHFRREPATGTCLECGHRFDVQPPLIPLCPACESPRLQVTGGREFYVESIEVEN
jgi:hydrogenase nickel incorporation protein HypA/HybF